MRAVAVSVTLAVLGCSGGSEPDEARSCVTLDGTRRLCGPDSVTLPLASDGSARVAARVNGQSVELLLDTGAEATVLSPSLLGVDDETLANADEICFGDLCFENEPVYAWETPFSSASGTGPSGFIGMHTLEHLGLGLDRGETATLSQSGEPCTGTSVAVSFNQYGIPLVDVTPHTLPAMNVSIDTGATYTLFSQATSDALGTALAEAEPAPLCTVNGCQASGAFIALVPSYCVAGECETDLPVKYPAFDAVGMTYFARRRVEFDFRGSALRFCAP
jgi:hypothetical protein